MDAKFPEALCPAFYIRASTGMSVIAPDLMTLMREIVTYCNELGKALSVEKFSNHRVCIEPYFRTTGGEALLVFEPYKGAQGVLKHVELELKGYVLTLNKISEQINANGLLRVRRPIEDVVGPKNTAKVLKAMSHLKSHGCIITGHTPDGEIEVCPPPLDAFATPAKREQKALTDAPVTGVELLQEGGCIVTVAHEFRVVFTDVLEDRARSWLAQPSSFSGRVSRNAGSWIVDTSAPYSFGPTSAAETSRTEGTTDDLPLAAKTDVRTANGDSLPTPPKGPRRRR